MCVRSRLALAVLLACCGNPSGWIDAPDPLGRPALPAVAREATLPIVSTEVTFPVGERTVPGTLVRPRALGPRPAVILLAGSGPTDRDWGSPLLATNNGSGKLLADELASRGAVVLRFDKAGAGKNPGPPLERFTIDTYREEALAAIAFVRALPGVRADRVFVAGHSEGGVHATRVALVAHPPVAGVLYLASAARPMAEAMLTQIEGNLRNPAAGLDDTAIRAELTTLRAALGDLLAGRRVDAGRASTIPQLQQLVTALAAPRTLRLTRQLLAFDNAAIAPRLAVPVLVLCGGKDVQVDPDLDARLLERTLRAAGRDVTFHLAPEADHLLKHEPRSLAELRADLVAVQHHYNAIDRTLDANAVQAIVDWLAERSR